MQMKIIPSLATAWFLAVLLITRLPCGGEERVAIPLEDATILQIHRAVAQGNLTFESLMSMYLQRIESYDKAGPSLNAILYLRPDAMEQARKMDEAYRENGFMGPLHGIPVLPKDNYDTFDMPTTGGYRGLADSTPLHDAYTIRRLREAGAIILGKTNLDEFNSGSSGTSGLGGQVLNPYNLNRSPGGSSAGTGSALAAVFGQVGLGTETGSSIRNPSTKNNLVGIAPTLGLVSRHGVVPSSILMDRTGPMARNVTDAALVLTELSGMDAGDLLTVRSIGRIPEGGYAPFLKETGLKNRRIGVLRENFGKDREDRGGLAVIERALAQLKEAGAVVIDPVVVQLDFFEALAQVSTRSMEKKEAMGHYLRSRGPNTPVMSLQDIVDRGDALGKLKDGMDRSLELPDLRDNPDYAAFLRNRTAFTSLIEDVYKKYDLDALVYPYQTKPAYALDVAAPMGGAVGGASNYKTLGRGTRVSTVTGFPAITVPAGFTSTDGMPVGLEFLGLPWTEGKLISMAYAFEQATAHRTLPESTPPLPGHLIVPMPPP